jgi:diadenosine tetraphosphate (Ap4A) HIT family hydrolase
MNNNQIKLLPRSKYKEYITDLKGKCVFCRKEEPLLIKELKYWRWMFAAFPYRKYHTLIVVKRHVIKFSDLNIEELLELKEILVFIESHYKKKNIVSEESQFGEQLFFSWRSRYNDEVKKSVSHLHLHIYPKFTEETNEVIGEDSHKIDWQDFIKV